MVYTAKICDVFDAEKRVKLLNYAEDTVGRFATLLSFSGKNSSK